MNDRYMRLAIACLVTMVVAAVIHYASHSRDTRTAPCGCPVCRRGDLRTNLITDVLFVVSIAWIAAWVGSWQEWRGADGTAIDREGWTHDAPRADALREGRCWWEPEQKSVACAIAGGRIWRPVADSDHEIGSTFRDARADLAEDIEISLPDARRP